MNLSWLLPAAKGIPVLIYHKVWPGGNDPLTISPERLREHLGWLQQQGFQSLSLGEYLDIIQGKKARPEKAVLLTFDDGYRNNLTYVYPLLREMRMKAAFFIIANTLDSAGNTEESAPEQKMTPAELRSLDAGIVQLGLHGYSHRSMARMGIDELESDIRDSIQAFRGSGLPFHMVLAYPYGARPTGANRDNLRKLMADAGITAAFRIGNKPSKVPPPDVYEIKRIDIRGTDTVAELAIKLRKGKLKPF